MLIHKATHEFASFCNIIVDDVKSPFSRVCQLKMKKDPLSSFSIKTKKIWMIFLFVIIINQIDSLLLWVCSAIDPRRCQNLERTSVTHYVLHNGLFAPFMFLA